MEKIKLQTRFFNDFVGLTTKKRGKNDNHFHKQIGVLVIEKI